LINAVTGDVEIGPKNHLYDYATYRALSLIGNCRTPAQGVVRG